MSLCIPNPKDGPIVLEAEDLSLRYVVLCDRHDDQGVREHMLVEHAFEGPLRILVADTSQEWIIDDKLMVSAIEDLTTRSDDALLELQYLLEEID